MSRATALAQRLRELKVERDEIADRKSAYDHDSKRAVAALARFHKLIEKEATPDNRRVTPTIENETPQKPAEQEQTQIPETEEKENEKVPGWAKKAFRAIALLTHPDKVNNDANISDVQRDRLVALYREASDAFHNSKYEIVAEIAAELEIAVEIPHSEMEGAFERKIASVKLEITSMQKTVSWVWGTSFGEKEIRLKVLKQMCQIMAIPTPSNHVLNEIIHELESQSEFDIIDRLGNVRRIKSGAERRKVGTRPEKRIR